MMATAIKIHPQYITDHEGHKTGVILSIGEFNEILEDLQDLAAIAERKDESCISHADVIRELKQDGLISG